MAEYFYQPEGEDAKALVQVYERFAQMSAARNKSYYYFNDRNLISFVDDSTKRWNGYVPPRDDLTMDWQTRIFNNFTRNFVISFLSKVAMQRPQAKFEATDSSGFSDVMRTHIVTKLYEYSKKREDGDWKFLMSAMEAVIKGTVINYEGYKRTKRSVGEIDSQNFATGKVKSHKREIVDWDDCFSHVVPIEDFFFGNIWEADMQKQPDVIWRQKTNYDTADLEFKKYPNWKYVKKGEYTNSGLYDQTTFYRQNAFADLDQNQVEIVRYFNKLKDQQIICCNGVVLYTGVIPFTHKELPFSKGVFELFATDFAYGNSLPNKIAREQDIVNTMWGMMLDQGLLSIYKPILNDDPDETDDIIAVPGLIKKVNDIKRFRVLNEFTGPDSSSFNLLNLAMRFAGDNSGNILGGGGSAGPRGGKITARQALLIEEESRQTLGLNATMLEKMECDSARLRAKNLIQFMVLPSKINEIVGADGTMLWRKDFKIKDTELSDGSYGTTIVQLGDNQMPQEELAMQEEMADIQKENLEILAVTPDYIRNLDIDVQIVPESSYMKKKSLDQAMGTEFYQLMAVNPIIDQEENTRAIIKLYDKDPDKLIRKQPMMNPMEGMGVPPPPNGATPQVTSQLLGRGQQRSLESLV
jgi:hypothetical protein